MRRVLFLSIFAFSLPMPALGQTWVEITPAGGMAPSPRRHASAVYDEAAHRMVIFAGENATGRLNDVWALDLATNTWSDLTPAGGAMPSPRRTPGSVYDGAARRMVTWSGQGGGFFQDTWSFDLQTHAWTEHAPAAPLPNPRYGVATCFDPLTGELVTFAGFTNAGRFDDTWRFEPDAEVWSDATPISGSPPERCLHSASYDARDHRMIMYGGQQSGPLDDVWAFDLATNSWADLTPAARPTGRFFAAHVYDARNHRSTIFGGTRGALGGVTDEVWLFDLTTEEFVALVPDGVAPTARQGSSAVYVESEDRMVVFGGYDTDYRGDVWSLEELSLTPTAVPVGGRDLGLVLHPARPNPFNPATTVRFELARAGQTTLRVYDVAGRLVTTLIDEERAAGSAAARWDGRDARGRPAPSGVYLVELRQDDQRAARKLLLAK